MKYFTFILGVLITVGSGFMMWHVMPPAGHVIDKNTAHLVYLFAGGVGFGMLLVIPTIMFSTFSKLLSLFGQYIPRIGGSRPADPPAAPPSTGGPT